MSIGKMSDHRRSPAVAGREDGDAGLASRILSEYREMPGLCLSAPQAARLWGLDADQCLRLLQGLVADGRLRCLPQGRYVAAA